MVAGYTGIQPKGVIAQLHYNTRQNEGTITLLVKIQLLAERSRYI